MPFDRMLISQAMKQKYHLMSDDNKFSLYDCKLIVNSIDVLKHKHSNQRLPISSINRGR